MKYSSIPVALFGLHNVLRGDLRAFNYDSDGVSFSNDRLSLPERVKAAEDTLAQIEKVLDENMMAIFKFYYGFHDKDNLDSPYVDIVSKIAYPANDYIGKAIIFYWRDGIRSDEKIAAFTGTSSRNARYKIKEATSKLDSYREQFIKLIHPLARCIEEILKENDLIHYLDLDDESA